MLGDGYHRHVRETFSALCAQNGLLVLQDNNDTNFQTCLSRHWVGFHLSFCVDCLIRL